MFRDVDAFERAMATVPSEAHGLKLCLGCFSEMPDHVPAVEGDTDWGHRARGYTVGYLRGLLETVGSETRHDRDGNGA